MTTDGANYTSMLFQVTISASNKSDLTLFAKVAAVGEKLRSQIMSNVFEVEHFAFITLAKIFDRIQNKYDVPEEQRLVMPKFYGYDGTYLEETLVMEDLAARGFSMQDRLESMSWEYAAKSLQQLGKMHALSIAFQEEFPKEFEEAAKVLKHRNFEDQEMTGMMQQFTKRTVAAIEEEHRDRLRAFLEQAERIDFWKSFVGAQRRPVLAHGDFKMSNVMHRQQEDKLDIVLVDYQCIQVGAGIRDVLYFLLSGTDEEFRLKHFHQLLDLYYEEVCLMLRLLKQEPEVLFPRKDYDYEVEKNLPCSLVVAMFVLPIITVAAEDAAKISEDMDLEQITDVKTGSLFEARINGIVRDCVRWGVI